VTFDHISDAHPANLVGTLAAHRVAHHEGESEAVAARASERSAQALTDRALVAGHASALAHREGTAIDAGGLLPDVARTNSWTKQVDEVDPLELLEVQLCNSTAPFLLVSRLRASMRAAVAAGARRAYVVNVSAMEGQFSRRYKGSGHPHTNMAKAALNMLTRTSAGEMFETDQILMTAVDTGWITDERPHHEKLRIADEGWRAPLDLVDGAARVYDPIVMGKPAWISSGSSSRTIAPTPGDQERPDSGATDLPPEPRRDRDGQGRGDHQPRPRGHPGARSSTQRPPGRRDGHADSDPARRSGRMSRRTPFGAAPPHRMPTQGIGTPRVNLRRSRRAHNTRWSDPLWPSRFA
jgi:NAD(P)-dependent dehydrogenase (short-subunit alcohol dehydrogenase family)